MSTEILIVEDENIVAMDIQVCLENLGYNASNIVSAGEDAIRQVEATRPNLVLMDIRLAGDMDGVETAQIIRSRFDVPVVYLTAQVDGQTLERAKATGPFGYILKPFEERDLHTTIEMALSKHAMERSLRESEERTRLIVENALDAVITIDVDGKITGWNPQAEKAFGWSREEVLGRCLAETIIPKEFRDDHRQGMRQFLAGGIGPLLNKRVEFAALRRNGEVFPIELAVSPVKTGGTYSFSAFIRDTTERTLAQQRLERSEQKYRTLVETTGTGYLIKDRDGRVVDANAEYVRLSGHLTLKDIQGRSVLEWTAPHDLERNREGIRRCIEQGHIRNLEIDYVDHEGRITPIEINATLIETDEETRILSLCNDITARRESEEALKRSNEDLEQYAYAVSHDLKDPLGKIMRNVQFLQRRSEAQLDERARENMEKIVQGTREMEQLINDLYENSKIGLGKVEAVDCQAVLTEVIETLQTAIDESAAAVTADSLPTVESNRTDMLQLFQNLIGNALKFCRDDTPPRIHVGCERQGGEWRFSVRDNGIGIAPHHTERVFQIFERLGEKNVDGTGIGLANCKKAVERRGGRIWVESQLNEGSTFFFTLPVV